MNKSLAILSLALLTACAQKPDPAMDQFFKDRADLPHYHQEGLASVSTFAAKGSCEGAELISAKTYLSSLRSIEARAVGVSGWLREVHARKMDVHFALADAAKKNGCYDFADQLYRDVINVYTGSAYAAERERARIGVDDIRAAKGSLSK